MTTKTSTAVKTSHPWSKALLLAKAQRYSQEMLTYSRDDWRFGLISTFVLEFLARSALANISPALLADMKSWSNLYFSLGYEPKTSKFIPKSIAISEVFLRLREVLSDFTPEFEGFSAQHINRRNEELHTGITPFDGVSIDWLPRFYETLDILLISMSEDLSSLIGEKESTIARQMIVAAKDESAKIVLKTIDGHKTVWQSKAADEQEKLALQASTWATRQAGHRVICPACGNDALVFGAALSAPIRTLKNDMITELQEYLPTKFECTACQLKIASLSQLTICKIGDIYKSTSMYDAAEYYLPEDEYPEFEDDNNEY